MILCANAPFPTSTGRASTNEIKKSKSIFSTILINTHACTPTAKCRLRIRPRPRTPSAAPCRGTTYRVTAAAPQRHTAAGAAPWTWGRGLKT
ncbi:unnamed protein product, partial [Brenthis ino]